MESNRILGALEPAVMERLRPLMTEIAPAFGDVLIEQYEPSELVYFPLRGAVLSLTRQTEAGPTVEVGVIGSEGIGGVAGVLDPRRQLDRGQVQAEGPFLAMKTSVFSETMLREASLREFFFRYTNAFLMQVAQTALCNRLHSLEQRLARWLLMMHDRAATDDMRMTQEFLSHMLGTRIAGVNEAVQSLTRAGLIAHARQRVTVIDRPALEAASCECYAVVKSEFDRVTD